MLSDDELRRMASAATPGPWVMRANAAYIAAAHPVAILALLDRAQAAEALVAQHAAALVAAEARGMERATLALRECVNALSAIPAFAYASRGTPARSSAQTLREALAALEAAGHV